MASLFEQWVASLAPQTPAPAPRVMSREEAQRQADARFAADAARAAQQAALRAQLDAFAAPIHSIGKYSLGTYEGAKNADDDARAAYAHRQTASGSAPVGGAAADYGRRRKAEREQQQAAQPDPLAVILANINSRGH